MKIYVGFSHSRSGAIGSRLIKWYLGTEFSHTYLVVQIPLMEETTVLHATGAGLFPASYAHFLEKNIPVREFELDISEDKLAEILNMAHRNFGEKYGFMQNIGVLFVQSLEKFGIKEARNPLNEGINCSEWLYEVLTDLYGPWTEKDKNLVTPKDVYEYLSNKEF
jgi:hypothetical protein